MADETPEPKPRVMWRSLPVCYECWVARYPERQAFHVVNGPSEECMVCDQSTESGIYVRMRVEWQ